MTSPIIPVNQPVATSGAAAAIDAAGNFSSTTLIHAANWAIVRLVGATVGQNAVWTLAGDNGLPVDFANGPLASMGQVLVAPGQRLVLTINAATTFAVVDAQYVGLMSPSLEDLLPHYTPSPNPLGATVRGAVSVVGGEGNFTDVIITGLSGAQTQYRLVGAVSGAAPTSGTFQTNDVVVDVGTPGWWVCTAAGTPGTWVRSESVMPVVYTVRADNGLGGILILNNPSGATAGHNTGIDYRANAVQKWFQGMDANGNWQLFDNVAAVTALGIANNSDIATFNGEIRGPDLAPSGLAGASNASRYVGATTGGAPTSGTFAVGDYVIDRNGNLWECVAAGTPGTWRRTDGWFGLLASAIVGTVATLSSRILQQTGSTVATTDAGGLITVTFPVTFPNGIQSILATPGDSSGSLGQVQVIQSSVGLSSFQCGCLTNLGSPINTQAVRVNWLAVGS